MKSNRAIRPSAGGENTKRRDVFTQQQRRNEFRISWRLEHDKEQEGFRFYNRHAVCLCVSWKSEEKILLSVAADRTTNNSKEGDTVAVMSLLKAGVLDFCRCLEYINMVANQIRFVTCQKRHFYFWTTQMVFLDIANIFS